MLSFIDENLSWDKLAEQSSWTIKAFMEEGKKIGIMNMEDLLKFAELAAYDFRTTAMLKIADKFSDKLDLFSER